MNDRLCASAVKDYGEFDRRSVALELAVPAPVVPFLRTDLDAGDGPEAPWRVQNTGEFSGVAVATRGGRTTMRACEAVSESRYVQATGRPVVLERRERLVGVAVAYPWIAWATRQSGGTQTRPTVRWKRIISPDRTAETVSLSGRLTALVPDVGGNLTTSTVDGGRQRIDTRDRAGRTSRIATFRNVSSVPRKALQGGLRDVWLWEPRTIAIDEDITESFSGSVALADFPSTAPSRVVDLPRTTSPCRLKSPGEVQRLRTTLASIDFIDAIPWTSSDSTHLRICDAKQRLVARGTVAVSSDGGSSFGGAALVGNALVVEGRELAGSSAGYTIERTVRVLAPAPSGRLVIARQDDTDVLAVSRTAAAWITTKTRQLWVSDAAGVRRVTTAILPGPRYFPIRRDEARLTLTDDALQIRTPQGAVTTVPITPLPASAVSGSVSHPSDQGCEGDDNRGETCELPSP